MKVETSVLAAFDWPLDGSIVGVYLLVTMIAGVMVRKYVGRVEDFLVAGREMKLYLGIASLAATEFGIVTAMYTAQSGYAHGFSGALPGIVNAIVMFVIGWTGFGVKPLRDSGVMTIPELFERRFGTFVRWLSGVVIVLGGLLNMGVFLRVGGQFLIVSTGMDVQYLKLLMTVLLVAVCFYTILGGMLSVLVTDYLQFIVMSVGLLLVTILVLGDVGWAGIVAAIERNYGAAGFNPFLNEKNQLNLGAGNGPGLPFVVSNTLTSIAAVLTWQTVISRVMVAKDTKTGRQIYTRTAFFFICRWMIPGLWGIAALATVAPSTLDALGVQMVESSGTLFAMPYYIGHLLPAGIMGVMLAAMLAADMSTDSSYMLTWSSVIYNDILAPFRRGQTSEKRGILINRLIVALIGIFLLFFGLWYQPPGDLWTYLQTTGTIYVSSMGVLLISCCYWKRANNWGAVAAIIVGAVLPIAALIADRFFDQIARNTVGEHWINIGTYAAVAVAMIVASLLKPGTGRANAKPA